MLVCRLIQPLLWATFLLTFETLGQIVTICLSTVQCDDIHCCLFSVHQERFDTPRATSLFCLNFCFHAPQEMVKKGLHAAVGFLRLVGPMLPTPGALPHIPRFLYSAYAPAVKSLVLLNVCLFSALWLVDFAPQEYWLPCQ
jgi:hypothetical protein